MNMPSAVGDYACSLSVRSYDSLVHTSLAWVVHALQLRRGVVSVVGAASAAHYALLPRGRRMLYKSDGG